MDRSVFVSHSREVRYWLGLYRNLKPEGLHGPRRGSLVERHTRGSVASGGRYVIQALAAAYPPSRQAAIMTLLKPQRLDDRLWRQVYALMVQGGPVWQWDLLRCVARLTSPDRSVADAEAIRLYQGWDSAHQQTASFVHPEQPDA